MITQFKYCTQVMCWNMFRTTTTYTMKAQSYLKLLKNGSVFLSLMGFCMLLCLMRTSTKKSTRIKSKLRMVNILYIKRIENQ